MAILFKDDNVQLKTTDSFAGLYASIYVILKVTLPYYQYFRLTFLSDWHFSDTLRILLHHFISEMFWSFGSTRIISPVHITTRGHNWKIASG